VLILAHGGKPVWNEQVRKVAAVVDKVHPTEIAFGMASRRNIQEAIDRLVARGVREIDAVPLFISSHSSVITSTEYLLGLRNAAPPELAVFARMSHGFDGHSAHSSKGNGHGSDGTAPINSPVPIRFRSALNSHPVVADILLTRADEISRDPTGEMVVVIAHGPVSDEADRLWLADIAQIVDRMRLKSRYAEFRYLTVRDDAPEPVKAKATEELRSIVANSKKRVLIVPLLLSYGGIEEGIRKRLDGLTYTMAGRGLLPDDRLAAWVLGSVVTKN